MIELILQGGLGNQLFILLQAYRLSSPKLRIVLNTSEFARRGRVDRPLLLPGLLPGIDQEFPFADGIMSKVRYVGIKLLVRLSKTSSDDPSHLPGDAWVSASFAPNIRTSYGYFQKIGDGRQDEELLGKLRDRYRASDPDPGNDRLALHLRRGDYMLAQHQMHGLVPVSAILAEARYALAELNFSGITVFTDSPELPEIEAFGSLGVPLEVDRGGSPIAVFKRLAAHKGIVASNSSFSLWGGLLSESRFFSIPSQWMPNVASYRLGLPGIRRYECTLL